MRLIYPLLIYMLLWPRFLDEMGVVPIKGEFGSIQIGDVFFMLFAFFFAVHFFSRQTQFALNRHKGPILMVLLFVGYWLLQVSIMSFDGSGRQSLNHLRSLLYYLFLLFFIARMKTPEDIMRALRLINYLVILIVIMQVMFFAVYNNPSMQSFISRNAPNFYGELYTEKRFMVTNYKCLFIVSPFLLCQLFFKVPEMKLGISIRFLSFGGVCFLFLMGQSRAIWLLLVLCLFLMLVLLYHKGKLNINKVAKLIPVFVVGALSIVCFVVLANIFVPNIVEKLRLRAGSLAVENIQQYEKKKEMHSLRSRMESYDLLLSRLGNDYPLGKGLGHSIAQHSAFKTGVDSTYLMVLWSGGIIPLLILAVFCLYTVLHCWAGYTKAASDFDIYFFTSGIASLVLTCLLALQDRILYLGNSTIMFMFLVAMILFMKRSVKPTPLSATPNDIARGI